MLILTRKMGEQIVIDGNITIAVVSIRGNRVRLGVTAPRDVPIHRAEVSMRGDALPVSSPRFEEIGLPSV